MDFVHDMAESDDVETAVHLLARELVTAFVIPADCRYADSSSPKRRASPSSADNTGNA